MAQKYTNIMQMLEAFYGGDVKKADAPVISTTTGVYNPVFGAQAFYQLNSEANAFSILPKYPWQKSGYRVITADAGTAGATGTLPDGGVGESSAIPDSTKPTFKEITVPIKQVAHVFQNSLIQEGLVNISSDDALGDMSMLRTYFASLHAKRINEMLLQNVTDLPVNNMESIDRVCSSYAEVTNCSDVDAGDADIYSIDRDAAASWVDAVVEENANVDRVLTLELIRDTLATLENNGARTNVILTGNDTKYRIFGIADTQVRYHGVVNKDVLVKIGLNGVETAEGMDFGMRVASVYGIPMFSSQAVVKDTISRIYLLDTTIQEATGIPRLGIALLYPTLYYESGSSAADKNPFVVDTFGTKGGYYTSGNLVCTFFKAQGKIRDLK